MAADGPSRPTEEQVMGLLRGVIDPELGSDIVDLGMAKGVDIGDDGVVTVTIALTTAGCPLRAQIQKDVRTRVGSLDGVEKVELSWTEMSKDDKAATMERARANAQGESPDSTVPTTTRVIAVASGKGGVGKSSVTVNLAAALAARGLAVGVLDADIWGFSIPRMLGLDGRMQGSEGGRIEPHELPVGDGRLAVVSMGFLVDDEGSALMWRGLMLNRAVQHFLEDVAWPSDLDYLLIDMPPGTGDVQMGLARMLPRAEMVIVTTPAKGAQKVAVRAADMARRSHLRVAGVIENMSAFTCTHGDTYALFGAGGGEQLATDAGVPLLGSIPLEPEVSDGGDHGRPIALGDGAAAHAFRELAEVVFTEAIPPVELAGCTAHVLEAIDAAVGDGPAADDEPSEQAVTLGRS